jgi:hypothetical protein
MAATRADESKLGAFVDLGNGRGWVVAVKA